MKFKLFLPLLLFFFAACGDQPNNPDVDPNPQSDLAKVREDMASHVLVDFIIPAFTQLDQDVVELQNKVNALIDLPEESRFEAVIVAHKTLWLSWQRASLFQFGPATTNGLRIAMNSYPTNPEKIEGNINGAAYTLGSLANQDAEGLPALDYLLNNTDLEPLVDNEARMNYLKALVLRMATLVNVSKTEFASGSYSAQFIASNGTDVGSAMGIMTNSVDWHFQRAVRDGKVAIPSGVRSANVPRPTSVEALYGGYSVELLVASMEAYRDYFKGKGFNDIPGLSFIGYLKEIDQENIAQEIEDLFDEIITKANALQDPLPNQIAEDNEAVIDVFMSMQSLINLFKSDMASVMGITITNQDNDGD